jgi:hypothetical protein
MLAGGQLVKRIMYCKSCGADLTPPLTVVEGHTTSDTQSNRRRRRGRSRLRKPLRDDMQPVLEVECNPMPDGMAYNSHVPYDKRGASRGDYMTIAPQIWMNLNDLLGDPLYTPHTERLGGCCGPCGADGPNRICRCGAHIGVEMSDCGTPRMFVPDPAATAWRDKGEIMTSEQVSAIIAHDLDMRRSNFRWPGQSMEECLLSPVLKKFINSFEEGELLDLWLVFEETPDSGSANSGYKIVYSEAEGMFGLAVAGDVHDVLIGFYGGFVETLNSM